MAMQRQQHCLAPNTCLPSHPPPVLCSVVHVCGSSSTTPTPMPLCFPVVCCVCIADMQQQPTPPSYSSPCALLPVPTMAMLLALFWLCAGSCCVLVGCVCLWQQWRVCTLPAVCCLQQQQQCQPSLQTRPTPDISTPTYLPVCCASTYPPNHSIMLQHGTCHGSLFGLGWFCRS